MNFLEAYNKLNKLNEAVDGEDLFAALDNAIAICNGILNEKLLDEVFLSDIEVEDDFDDEEDLDDKDPVPYQHLYNKRSDLDAGPGAKYGYANIRKRAAAENDADSKRQANRACRSKGKIAS